MKFSRTKFLAHLSDPDEKNVLARVLDKVELVCRTHRPVSTHFFDPYALGLVTSLLEQVPEIDFAADGGYEYAERARVAVVPDYLEVAAADFELAFLSVRGNFKMVSLSHRDYLGSLLALGLKREMIGDILVGEQGAQVIVAREIARYIEANLNKVHRVGVTVREIRRDELVLPEVKVKEIATTVASLRLDSIAAAGFGTSRSKLVREITAERISLNWQPTANAATPVQAGDMLSMRGRGRVEVAQVKGPTRSGRIPVVLKRYV